MAALQRNDLDAAITSLRAAVAFGQRAGARDGRLDEALEDLRRAIPVLRRAEDAQWAARALSNRGLLQVNRRAFAQAEADLTEAGRLREEHDLTLAGVYVEKNLGYVNAQRGNVPAALHHFNLAEDGYRRLGLEVGALLTDRARASAEAAVDAYQRQGRQISVPEAELILSTIAPQCNNARPAGRNCLSVQSRCPDRPPCRSVRLRKATNSRQTMLAGLPQRSRLRHRQT